MKVIFIEDVPNVARAGETKVVADGYGRNFLLPRKLAVLADSQASALVEAQLKKRVRLQAQTEAEMAELAAKLNGMEITLRAKAGARERLYGSVTSADIAEAMSKSARQVVDKRKVELAEPIHQLGSYDVTVRFTHDIAAVIKLTVAAETPEAAVVEKKAEEKPAEEAKAGAEPKKVKKKAEKKIEEAKAEAKPEEKKEKKTRTKKAEEAEAEAEKKVKEVKAKVEEKEEKKAAEEKAEKKTRTKKAEEGEARPEKKVKVQKEKKEEKKAKTEKKVEEAGEKDAEPGK